ncbi:MAG: hypothetical protein JRI68_25880, partial [Deltaproteobacteria bacterium]|nr:hypothetical protein [Deltaproteobacteria bacterium]
MKSLAHFHPPGALRAPSGERGSSKAKPSGLVSIGAALAVVVATAGCTHGRVEMQKKLTELTHEVTKLRASNLALQDRVDSLEAKAPRARSPEGATAEQPNGRPNLEVVRLAPEAPEVEQPPVEAPPEPAA